jgi:type IV fimbrial biogenesis protein FimT
MSRGFTLTEMLVVVAILALGASLSAPSLIGAISNLRCSSYANDLLLTMKYARSEAIKRNTTISVCASTDGLTCGTSWTAGWIVLSNGSILRKYPNANGEISITSGPNTSNIDFTSGGYASTSTLFTICSTSHPNPKRKVNVNVNGGSYQYSETSSATCT